MKTISLRSVTGKKCAVTLQKKSPFRRQCSHFPPKHHANYTVKHLATDKTSNCDRFVAYNFRESKRHKNRLNNIIRSHSQTNHLFLYIREGALTGKHMDHPGGIKPDNFNCSVYMITAALLGLIEIDAAFTPLGQSE